jgi:THO complex subunit 5
MESVRQIKKSGVLSNNIGLDELKVHGVLQFVSLKKLNRIAHFRSKKVKDSTSEAKLKVDQHHLKLQNLLYEVAHLEKEIGKCLQFRSKDEDVPLVPVEHFYREASADIAKPNITRTDAHQLRLARLHWELEQRKRLSMKLQEAAGLKDHIMGDIKAKKEFLDSLQPKLGSILQATKPVQDQLGMQFDVIREQHRTASYLPSPLYVLYIQASAYSQACDKNLLVSIEGDIELAQTMEKTPVVVDEDDDDGDEQDKPTDVGRRRSTSHQDKTHHLFVRHPLSVCLIINCPDKSQLSLNFYYLMSLGIVTVSVTLCPSCTNSSICGGDLLQVDTLLNCLYADDDGCTTPNPANMYLPVFNEFSKHVSEVGRPYRWVQWLCGLQFLASDPQKALVSVSACHMAETVKRLCQRVHVRLSLQQQLAALETCRIPIPSECVSFYPSKISSMLVQWKRTTLQDFNMCSYTKRFFDLDLVRRDSMFFTATIQRVAAVLTAQIVVSADYPNTVPLIALSLQWHGAVHTALDDDAVRDMEAEVNKHYTELVSTDKHILSLLLTSQLQRLLVCLDVYLEMKSVEAASIEFSQDRICSRLARGRSRTRPYKYNPQLCFFSQR